MPRWLRGALIAAACVIGTAGVRPWIDAAGGAFIPADIAQDAAAARLFAAGISPYGPQIREAHATLVGLPVSGTFPYFPHPPFSLIVSWPLAAASYATAAMLWFSFTLVLIFVLAVLLAEMYSARRTRAQPRLSTVSAFFVLLLLWPPVLYNLEKGQWSILLAVLLALAWRSLSRGMLRSAGVWIGVAASVKVFPVVLGLYLVVRSRAALVWFLATGGMLTALPLVRIGMEALPAFVQQSRLNMPYWETFPSVTLSVHGAVARLLVGGQWAHPLIHAPMLGRVIEAVVILTLLSLAFRLSLRAHRGQVHPDAAFAAWVVTLPMLNPQSLGHNGVLLALPLALTAGGLVLEREMWPRVAWALALALVSIPRQTLWRLAPPPIEPAEGLGIIALPLWGALLLFILTVAKAPAPGAGHPMPRNLLE